MAQEGCENGTVTVVGVQEETLIAGQLEICVGGEWRAVCHYEWTLKDDKVVCQFPDNSRKTTHTAVTTVVITVPS